MTDKVFVDTNIIVYAYDLDAGSKRLKAKALLTSYWEAVDKPWISVQVLQELFVTLQRCGVDWDIASQIAHIHMSWQVVETDIALFSSGIKESRRWQLSFWDGLILAAARRADVQTLLSEDFNTGQNYDGIVVVNPFIE